MRILTPVLLSLVSVCPGSTLLLNPSFEDSDMSPWIRNAITGSRPWGRGAANPQDGDWMVFTIEEASIEQSFGSILGSDIEEFSFWIDRPDTATVFVELLFSGGGTSGQIDITSSTGPSWGQYNVQPLIDDADNVEGIRVIKLGTGTTRLDNFRLSTVPEPNSAFLVLGGLFLGLNRRSRTRV